jgi:ergothioneine biosynthesis protein EgtB
MPSLANFSRATLEAWTIDARARTLDLVRDLSDDQFLHVPLLRIVNPFLWEIGHVAHFQEYWVLRQAAGNAPMLPDADSWYDSARVSHDIRWELPLPSRSATVEYLGAVRDKVLDRLAHSNLNDRDTYFMLLAIFHEDMHDEAFMITRQTLGYPPPSFPADEHAPNGRLAGDVTIPAGSYVIGSRPEDGFIFDNEKWAHAVDLAAFQIARAPVTQQEFLLFLQDSGYTRREFWTEESWAWRERERIAHPTYWRNSGDEWERRHFNQWVPLEPHPPVSNISWFEADAYCRWARRRLPTEFEWEAAAGKISSGKIWEWTASDFLPYPGFSEDPYKEYSKPWFGTHKTLRGGAWSTRSRLVKRTYRNFYTPDRRDIWAGIRTCAVES